MPGNRSAQWIAAISAPNWAIPSAHSRYTEDAVRAILKAGAMPIVLGGDHGVPIPVLRAFDGDGPITLIQIDQHIDWRDEVNGVREGLSSTIRRASEMAHIGEIFQIGLRATGSARTEEVEAAHAYGAHLITAWELHEVGMDAVLAADPRRRTLLHHGRSRWDGPDGCAGGGGAFAGRRDVRSGTQADPWAGAQRTRRRNGCGGDHAAKRREPDHLHHGRAADREPDRDGGAGGILRQGGTSPAEDPARRPASDRYQTRARSHRSGDDG